jgi:hypothetical protein
MRQGHHSFTMKISSGLASPDTYTAIVFYVEYPHTASRMSEEVVIHNSCRNLFTRETSITILYGL